MLNGKIERKLVNNKSIYLQYSVAGLTHLPLGTENYIRKNYVSFSNCEV
jgi:hypothetical protein